MIVQFIPKAGNIALTKRQPAKIVPLFSKAASLEMKHKKAKTELEKWSQNNPNATLSQWIDKNIEYQRVLIEYADELNSLALNQIKRLSL